MAFDTKDTSAEELREILDTAEEVTYRRNRKLPGVKLDVIVTRIVEGHRRSFRVPSAKVDAGWPGTQKTLRDHLFDAIDNAE